MSRVAWKLRDPQTSEIYTFLQNPKSMTSPRPKRAFDAGACTDGKTRVLSKRIPVDWEFSGTFRSQLQYNAFLDWFNRPYPIVVIDHFGVEHLLIVTSYDPQEKRSFRNSWVHSYTVKGRILLKEFLSGDETGWLT